MVVGYDLVVTAVSLGLVTLLSVPSISTIARQLYHKQQQYRQLPDQYEDADGTATAESIKAHSDIVPRLVIAISSSLGFVVSTAFVILSTIDKKARCVSHEVECRYQDNLFWLEQCLTLGIWAFVLSQAVIIFKTSSSILKYNLGVFGASSCLLLTITLSAQVIGWRSVPHSPPASNLYYTFALIQVIFALVLVFAFVLIPRRPHVYRGEKSVDREFTTTLLGRATFSWAGPLLRLASTKKNLELEDLPLITNTIRAVTLRRNFDNVPKNYPLWKAIFLSNRSAFLLQWTLQIFQSFTNFFPQVALLISLRLLEARDAGEDKTLELWLLVLILGISDAAQAWLETSMFYVCFNKLGAPVYEQISSIVFAKALIKKDVKGVSKDAGPKDDSQDILVNENSGHKGEDTVVEEGAEDEVARTKQSTINLIGVDGKRIADFATYNCMILGSSMKIMIALVFLVNLVGWIPLFAGFGAFAALMPLNWWVTSRYAHAQDLLMKCRDAKMAVISEALQGIRQIKFSALEREWHDKIGKSRNKELKTLWRAFMFDVLLISIWIFGPVILSAITLAVYTLLNKTLTPSVAFTTVSVFEAIEVTLGVIPEVISEGFDSFISARRIQEYLNSADQDDDIQPGESIKFEKATVSWPTDSEEKDDGTFTLRGANLSFPNDELTVISGKTGSGKSLLLAAIVGEAEIVHGTLTVPRAPPLAERFDQKANRNNWIINTAIAYVSQIPWIENATIKDNILFGLPLDQKRYKDVLEASALEKDLEILQDGDMTDIGANGINLSGGQKWRVSFARALYSRAGILILDDIFSAVDAHVGKHLYEKALIGPLGRGRTRVLVTHHVALCLPGTKYSVLLENGVVVEAGYTDELRQSGALKKILAYDVEEQQKEDEEAVAIDDGGSLAKILSHRSGGARRVSTLSQTSIELTRSRSHAAEMKRPEPKRFTEDEKREVGSVRYATYSAYINACGGFSLWSFILLFFLAGNALYLGRSYWVSVWTRSYSSESTDTPILLQQLQHLTHRLQMEIKTVNTDSSLYYYLGIYLAISLVAWLFGSIKYFFAYFASIRASKRLFDRLSWSILRAPLRFLDTTPLGRILNRFTADFNLVDSKMANDVAFSLHSAVSAFAVIIAGSFVSPLMLLAAAVLVSICIWFAKRYLMGAREIKRLESNAKSPVFEQFGSVLTGIGTIRAFGKADEYMQRMENKIDTHCQAYSTLWLLTRWMSLRIGFTGSIFLTIIGALVVSLKNIDASLAGFALSFSLQLSECIIWALRQYSNVELNMNAIERVVEYSAMPVEEQGGLDAPAAWPTKGEVEVDDLVVSYAKDLSPVLKGLTFHVRSNERIGVVGRTGAGKSSLTLALFRFLEARSGAIHIDGVDISKIKLYDLRSRLAIIPQDPVLFSGTIRSNLDAFDQLEDSQLRDALARVHLTSSTSAGPSGSATPQLSETHPRESDANTNIFKSLYSKISEGGLNLSQGQRQLLCLARAIVSRPKIMVLDEATSSVDMETDALIQRSIREEFADSTLIVIAHRLSTIVDFDRILVLGEGKVLEFDSPANLMRVKDGVFRSMVEESGERKELEGIIHSTRHSTST